jgi:hypothetical protein
MMAITKALFLLYILASAIAQEITTLSTATLFPLPTAVIHLNPPAQQTDPSYTSDSDFQSQMIYAHNWFRAEHSASDLTWNESCAASSQAHADKFIWKHLVYTPSYPPLFALSCINANDRVIPASAKTST